MADILDPTLASARKFDPLAVVEAACQHTVGYERWASGVLRALAPRLEVGHGMLCYRMSLAELQPRDAVLQGADPGQLELVVQGARTAGGKASVRAVEPVGLFSSASVFGEGLSIPEGLKDSYALGAVDGEGELWVGLASSSELLTIPDEEADLWRHLGLHIGAGLRLLRHMGALDDAQVEVVLSPGGDIHHAQPGANDPDSLEQLRATTKRIDAARTRRGRADPEAALSIWQALLLGRWSLVDHFDTDGRRFVVARRNDPDCPAPEVLSRRERQVVFFASIGLSHRQIGYALGLAPTTAATHLRRALDKLHLSSREELIELAAKAATAARTPDQH